MQSIDKIWTVNIIYWQPISISWLSLKCIGSKGKTLIVIKIKTFWPSSVKCWTNCLKTAISGIFPGLPTGKKFFTRNGYHHSLNMINTHLWAKNHKKLMMKSWEKSKKPWFPAYFRHFRPEKLSLFYICVPNFSQKYCSSVKICLKSHFSGVFGRFRRFFNSSGCKEGYYC